ncbi:hypothetical protein [Elizabethkingia anophelis]|uniref:hypothetical protein n=1 Tax=Elizabethkingia anophelis TaxID=1117645 RepID=UPI00200F4DB4|nr:hypothetical protein [Elizabethkingia anophelis]MCL1032055.1 hypothetical protein [Elizabethkingia anophelis]MCW2463445.1 hypothetical protein [Elizabethkingia anophelis]MCW2467130.1 hypothetical protein [Elizabethkingia anophelis]MCW2470722.1 hypothetical protein [Elizabethkingia anophelis]HBI9690598.1 hypothetical protein [Elizabethkingia anophelis]
MNKNLFYLLPIFILFFSCRNSDSEPRETLIREANLTFNPPKNASNSDLFYYYNFKYDTNNRLVERIGAPIMDPSGKIITFTYKISTTIEYGNKSASIKESSTELIVSKDIKENLIFNESNQIIERNIINETFPKLNKKTKYFYNGKLLVKTETTFPNNIFNPERPYDYIETIIEKFAYDPNENLQNIITTRLITNGMESTTQVYEKQFGNYDTSRNPFKKLNVLNDYLERSLSRNNFRYMAVIYYTSNSKQLISETEWNFNYDSNGNIISSNSITLE